MQPSPILAPYIKHYWIMEASGILPPTQRIIPIGLIHLVFHRRDRMICSANNTLQPSAFISGQMTNFTDLALRGEINMVVVVFQPYGAKAFFSLPIDELYNKDVSIKDVEDPSLLELENRLLDALDNKSSINLIERFFIKRLHTIDEYNFKRISPVITAINNQQTQISITSLSKLSCLSYKQFNRIFSQYVGINPKEFSRIIRFQRALYILQSNNTYNLTQLAIECGYYDQSHLIKEFRTFTGHTPSEFIALGDITSDYFSRF